MKRHTDFIVQHYGNETVIIPVGSMAYKKAFVLKINKVTEDIFNYLENEHTKEELMDYLLSVYDVSKEVLELDVDKVLDTLIQKGVIKT
jgi:hypothetical protein